MLAGASLRASHPMSGLTSPSCCLCHAVAAWAPCPGELPPPCSCRQPGHGCTETKDLQGTAAQAPSSPHKPRSLPMLRALDCYLS